MVVKCDRNITTEFLCGLTDYKVHKVHELLLDEYFSKFKNDQTKTTVACSVESVETPDRKLKSFASINTPY
ncbi:hypothetical protein N7539_004930 [Penicillium diatomitis]|uniref:Uncharacterized protein n=1 Tax=Penicillium diatomitis TaxID=2819901 RepID=A0A9W9X613_9EURO|nr:uncharacterized protein N7539_004930 [Penicillium diatomitis]KAJ5484942.1 hypothetical protein N7539_004930 [Penicillium diatomitis]